MPAHESPIWKTPCRAASTVNIASLSTALTIDGVALAAGDRVLVKNQTTASANGIYIVATGAWSRSPDGSQDELLPGSAVFITEGTINSSSAWVLTNAAPITVGTTNLSFAQLSGVHSTPLSTPIYATDPAFAGGMKADSTGPSTGTDNAAAFAAALSALRAQKGGELHVPWSGGGIYRMSATQIPWLDFGTVATPLLADTIIDFHGSQLLVDGEFGFDTVNATNRPYFLFWPVRSSSSAKLIIRNLHLVGPHLNITDATFNQFALSPSFYDPTQSPIPVAGGIVVNQRCQLENVTVEGFQIGVSIEGDHGLIGEQCSIRNNTVNLWYDKTDTQKDNVLFSSYFSRARLASVGVHPYGVRLTNDEHTGCHLGLAPFGILRPKYGLPRNDGGTSAGGTIFTSSKSIFTGNSAPNQDNVSDNVQVNDILWILSGTDAGKQFVISAVSATTLTTSGMTNGQSGLIFAVQRATANYTAAEQQFIVNHVATDTTVENCGNAWIWDDTDVGIIQWQGDDKPQFSGIDDNIQMPWGSSLNVPRATGTTGALLSGGTFYDKNANFTGGGDPVQIGDWLEILGPPVSTTTFAAGTPNLFTVTCSQPHGVSVGDVVLLTWFDTTGSTAGNTEKTYQATVYGITSSTVFTASYPSTSVSIPSLGTPVPVMVREQMVPLAITSSTNATPIVLTIPAHSIQIGDSIIVDGHQTNTAANGTWVVSAVGAGTVTLQGSVGNGVGGMTGYVYRRHAGNARLSIGGASNTNPITITSTAHGLINGQTVVISGQTPNTNANGTWVITYVDANNFQIPPAGNGATSATGNVWPVGPSWFFEGRARWFKVTGVTATVLTLEVDPLANAANIGYRVVRWPRMGLRAAQLIESSWNLAHGESLYYGGEMYWSLANPPADTDFHYQSPLGSPTGSAFGIAQGGLPPTIQVRNFASYNNRDTRTVARLGDRVLHLWRQNSAANPIYLGTGDVAADFNSGATWQTQLYSSAAHLVQGVVALEAGPAGTYVWVVTQGTFNSARFASALGSTGEVMLANPATGGLVSPVDGSGAVIAQVCKRVGTMLAGYTTIYLFESLRAATTFRYTIGPWGQATTVAANQANVNLMLIGGVGGAGLQQQSWIAPRAGWITAIVATVSTTATNDRARFFVTKNGSQPTPGLVVAINNGQTARTATQDTGAIPFAAGDLLGVQISTLAGWTPTANSAVVFIEVIA